jgi:hypothetical protein
VVSPFSVPVRSESSVVIDQIRPKKESLTIGDKRGRFGADSAIGTSSCGSIVTREGFLWSPYYLVRDRDRGDGIATREWSHRRNPYISGSEWIVEKCAGTVDARRARVRISRIASGDDRAIAPMLIDKRKTMPARRPAIIMQMLVRGESSRRVAEAVPHLWGAHNYNDDAGIPVAIRDSPGGMAGSGLDIKWLAKSAGRHLPLAARPRVGHIGLIGAVAEWLKAAVC